MLVLGAGGFIGGRLVAALREERDFDVHGLTSGDCDLRDPAAVQGLRRLIDARCSVVICSAVTRRREDSWNAFRANVQMCGHLADLFSTAPPRSVIYLSSTDVYGLPPAELPIRDVTPPRPVDCYGVAKLACESRLRNVPQRRWPLTVLRLPGVFGAGDRQQSVVGRLAGKMSRGEPVSLTGEGRVRRDFLAVEDLIALIRLGLSEPVEAVCNAAGGQCLSLLELVGLLGEVLKTAPRVEFTPADPARDHDLEFDLSGVRRQFPEWRPTPLRDALRRFAESLQADASAEQQADR